jgi:hypothetical protein
VQTRLLEGRQHQHREIRGNATECHTLIERSETKSSNGGIHPQLSGGYCTKLELIEKAKVTARDGEFY